MLREATGAKSVFGEPAGIECAVILLEDGDELEFGNFSLKAIATPGHTDACTSFYTKGMLFTGDSLLIRGCGRTDLQLGDPENFMKVLLKNCTPIRTTPWFILVMIIWDVQPHLSEGKKLLIPELAADKRWKYLSKL
jgi:hypothetical protein